MRLAEHAGHQGLISHSKCGLGGPEGPDGCPEGRSGGDASALPGGCAAAPNLHVRCGCRNYLSKTHTECHQIPVLEIRQMLEVMLCRLNFQTFTTSQ